MSKKVSRKVLSALLVGLLLLGAFVALTAAHARAATTESGPASEAVELASPAEVPISDVTSGLVREDSWRAKLSSSLQDIVSKGSKDLQEIVIYTRDMPELAPLLNKFAVRELPEALRGESSRSAMRTQALSEGIVSTRATVPAYAIAEIAKLPGVLGVEAPALRATADYVNLDLTEARERLTALRDQLRSDSGSGPVPVDWGIVRSQHVVDSAGNYPMGYNGTGVYVAVQDWGVDFAHPNLNGQWATVRDPTSPYFGYPIMHSQMSLWNNLELFTASSDYDRYPYPHFATFGTASWFSDTSYIATADPVDGTIIYRTGFDYGFFQFTKRNAPSWPSCPGSTSLIDRTYYVGTASDPNAIPSASGWYHLGVHKDKYLEGLWCTRVGILVTDPTAPGVYDTVYVDLNNNNDFTDDTPLTVTGNPLAGWDADGDGIFDVSGGLLYFVATRTNSITDEVVLASATGTETSANLANGWIETDVEGFNLYMATMYQNGNYWPSSGEDIWEPIIPDTTGAGNETGTTSQLTFGYNIMTFAGVDTASLLAHYPLRNIYAIYNSTRDLVEGVDFILDYDTGQITWLVDFPDGDFVDIIYEFLTWRLNFDTGEILFEMPPIAGAQVTATYNTGLPVPYANVTARRQGWDLFVPGPGDLVAFHGAFELGQEHGTWVSTNLAGVPFGNAGGIFDIWGTAPGAKIIGVDLPTSIDDAEVFYFSAMGYDGIPGTGDEANIITNSWGYVEPQNTGYTFIERYLYDLTTNVVPETTILFAAGNNGPGYGTSTPPNTAPGIITVGGGTLMNYRWLFGYDGGGGWYDWPGIGEGQFGVGPYGDIVDFASKGPTLMGTPEPDVFTAAAFGFGGRPLNSACLEWYCYGPDAWDLWSGTSMATPVAAGIVALIYQAYQDNAGTWPDSSLAKEILMSSADDHGFDPLQQGAGWANGTAAVELATSTAGLRVSPAFLTPGTYGGVHRPAFANLLRPGESYVESLTVYNEGASAATLTVGDAYYAKIGADYNFTWDFTNPGGEFRILKPSGLYAADGSTPIELVDLSAQWNSAASIRITVTRDPETTTGIPYTGLEFFDWWDSDGDGIYDGFAERNRFSFWGFEANRWSTAGDLYSPSTRVHDGLVLRMRDFGGSTGKLFVKVEFYGKTDWTWADAEAATGQSVSADGSLALNVTFSVPAGTPPGMYEGAVWVESGGWRVIVPVVITVPSESFPAILGGGTPATSLYDNNGVAQGQGPGTWRQIGDSRYWWVDFSPLGGVDRKLIYTTLLGHAPSEAEFFLYELVPDTYWTDDAIYGPGMFTQLLASGEARGSTNTNYINREFVSTDVISGPLMVQVKALTALYSNETLRVEIGMMTTTPQTVRISTNKLSGSVPVTVAANVPLYDGLALVGFQKLPGDGVLTHEDPIVASSTTPTAIESVSVGNPPDNTYFIAVHGWDVPSGSTTFDMTVSITTAAGTTTETFTGLVVLQDNPADPYTSSFVQARSLVSVTRFDVSIAGISGNDLDLYVMSDAPQLVLGGGNFVGINGPPGDVPANMGAQIDLSWLFPGDTREGVITDLVYASPGFAPGALVQPVNIVFSYDLTPPSFSGPLPAPASVTNDPTPGIFVQIDDNQAGSIAQRGEIDGKSVRIWLDGVDITSLASISVPHVTNVGYPTGTVLYQPVNPLAEGAHTILVNAGDLAGNVASTSWTFFIDTTAPALDILSPPPGLVTSASSVTLTGRTEVGATVTVAGQVATVDESGQFFTTVTLSEGPNSIEVSAADAMGNTAVTTVLVVRDATAPSISLLKSSAGLVTRDAMTVVSGVVSEAAFVTVAGIPATVRADGSFEVPVALVEGTNTVTITATDAAGNAATPATLTIVRDTTPPALTLDTLPSEVSSATITVTGTVESGISFVTVNGQPVAVSGGRFSAEVVLSFGPNIVFVEATDEAGNRAMASAAVSYVPTGVTSASVGLILLPVLTVIALLAGLAIGQMRAGRGGPPKEEEKKEAPPAEEELPPEGGEL